MANHILRSGREGGGSRAILGDLSSISKKSPEAEPLRDSPKTKPRGEASSDGFRHTDTETLKLLLKDDSSMTRFMAATTLGERGDAAIEALSEAVLNETNPLIRIAAADALGKIGEKPAIPALQKVYFLEKDQEVSWRAGSALDMINQASMDAETILRESAKKLKESVASLMQDDPLAALAAKWLSLAEAKKDGMTNKQKTALSGSLNQMTVRILEIKESERAIVNTAGGLVISGSEHIARMLVKVQRDQFERKFGKMDE